MKLQNLPLWAFFCLFSLRATAQNKGTIRGKALDNTIPIEFANVLLYAQIDSSKIIKNTVTDSTGSFVFTSLSMGAYSLKIQLIGYVPKTVNIQLNTDDQPVDLEEILLETDTKLLKTVEVTARKALIQRTPQGLIINASATLTQQGGTATDLLRNTPTVAVDAEGGITLRGKTPLILINGRNSSLSNMEQIQANSIESIEIINNPSAQYDADAEGGIINIKLKKNQQNGTNGAAALGTGYGAKGRINSSLLLSHKAGKWNIGLSYDNRFAGRIRKVDGDRVNFTLPTQYYLTQRRFDDRIERNQNLKFNVDYTLNPKNTLSFEAIGTLIDEDNDESLTNLLETETRNFVNKYRRRSIELRKGKVGEFALMYKRKFEDERKSLSANVSSSLNNNKENTDITTQTLFENGSLTGNPFLQRTNNYQTTNVNNVQLDYVQPISQRSVLETGYKGILRVLATDFQSLDKTNGTYGLNPKTSNTFDFNEQIHAVYAQINAFTGDRQSQKMRYTFGVRAEQVWNKGQGKSNSLTVDNQYFNLYPTANIAYYLRPNEFLKLSYGRRINRPGLGALNPFTDITDSLTQRSGNPNLKPELVHSLELGYSREWDKISFSSLLFYRRANNLIQAFTILRPDGVLFTQPLNFGNSVTYGSENILTANFNKFWDTNLSFSLFQQIIDGSNIGSEVGNSVFSWYGKMINNFTMWKGSKLQLIGVYNSPIATPQGERVAIYNADVGFQQKVIKGKGRFGLIITDIFNTQRSGFLWDTAAFSFRRMNKVDSRAIVLTFAFTFGTSFKEKMMENKFSNE
jgi:outer membrane receptor protein involved in Fe transport